jgi:cell volume regulation protein A
MEDIAIGFLGAFIFAGICARLFFQKTGITDVILLLLGGMLAAAFFVPTTAGLDSYVPIIGTFALAMIVFSEGLNLSLAHLKHSAFPVLFFGFISFAFAFIFIFIFLFLFGWQLYDAALMAAILASVAPEITGSVVEELRARDRIRNIVKLEGIFSDALGLVLSLALLSAIIAGHESGALGNDALASLVTRLPVLLAYSVLASAALGTIGALLWKKLFCRIAGRFEHLSSLGLACILFAFSSYLGANGVLAVFIFGFFLGNMKHETLDSLRWFQEEIAFFFRTFFFFYLGLIVPPQAFLSQPLLIVAGVLVFLAIAASRFLAASGFASIWHMGQDYDVKLLRFLSQRGLSAAILAALAINYYARAGMPTPPFAEVAFLAILFTNIASTGWIFAQARRSLTDRRPLGE